MSNTRWTCPVCDTTRLAPRRARRDDTRIYCLDCSAQSTRLVRRVRELTFTERKRKERTRAKASLRAAAKREAPKAQSDVNARFQCGVVADQRDPGPSRGWPKRVAPDVVFHVVPSKRPRRPRFNPRGGIIGHTIGRRGAPLITIYDWGGDIYDARAQIVVAYIRWSGVFHKDNAARLKERIRQGSGVLLTNKADIRSLAKAEEEVANLYRREVAASMLGNDNIILRATS